MNSRNSRTVYSTDSGRLCASCSKPQNVCVCQEKAKKALSGDGIVRISRESKGRKGKGVSLISGLPLAADELKALAKKLKQLCGSGGAVKAGVIEIQGDHRDKLLAELVQQGYQVKLAGG